MTKTKLKYKSAFDLFLLVIGMEHGDVYHLPYSGGVMEQPYKTNMMWSLFKNELVAHIGRENKKRAQKMRRK